MHMLVVIVTIQAWTHCLADCMGFCRVYCAIHAVTHPVYGPHILVTWVLCQMRLMQELSCISHTHLICSHHIRPHILHTHLQHAVHTCDCFVFATRLRPLYCSSASSAVQPAKSDCKTVTVTGAVSNHSNESAASTAAAGAGACNATASFIGLHQRIGVANVTASLLSRQPSQLSPTPVCGQRW